MCKLQHEHNSPWIGVLEKMFPEIFASEISRSKAIAKAYAEFGIWVRRIVSVIRKPKPSAEDVTQDVLVRLFERDILAQFDPARASMRTFVNRIIFYVAMEHRRKNRNHASLENEPAHRHAEAKLAQLDRRELLAKVLPGLALLSEAQLKALVHKLGCPICHGNGGEMPIPNLSLHCNRGLDRLRSYSLAMELHN